MQKLVLKIVNLGLLAFLGLAPYVSFGATDCALNLEVLGHAPQVGVYQSAVKMSFMRRLFTKSKEFPITLEALDSSRGTQEGFYWNGERLVLVRQGEVPGMATHLPVKVSFENQRPRFEMSLNYQGDVLHKELNGNWIIGMKQDGSLWAVPWTHVDNLKFNASALIEGKFKHGYLEEANPVELGEKSIFKSINLEVSMNQFRAQIQNLLGDQVNWTMPAFTQIIYHVGPWGGAVLESRLGHPDNFELNVWLVEINRRSPHSNLVFEWFPEQPVLLRVKTNRFEDSQSFHLPTSPSKARHFFKTDSRGPVQQWGEGSLPQFYRKTVKERDARDARSTFLPF
ncbi:MAG: hypothetical protein IT289_04300 [Oligoflexia bacterium]|nr:hypothetical protein [Oligoflexia bacterium]